MPLSLTLGGYVAIAGNATIRADVDTPLALFGSLMAMLPWSIIRLFAKPRGAVSDGSVIRRNGIPTASGIIDMVGHLGAIFAAEFSGGIIFHSTVQDEAA